MKRLYQLIERATGRVLDEKEMRRDEALTRNNALFSEFHRGRTLDAKKKLARWEIAAKETGS